MLSGLVLAILVGKKLLSVNVVWVLTIDRHMLALP